MPWLLDTNVLAELRRPSPDRSVVSFVDATPAEDLFVSTVTLAEIRFGNERAPDSNKRGLLHEWLERRVRPYFGTRVLHVTEDVMLRWRQLVEEGRKAGRTYSQPDLIIAAIALEHGLPLVTRNTTDFAGTGVRVANPWQISLP